MSYPGKKALDLYNAVGEPTENPDDPLCLITITDRSARCYRGVIERRQYLERLENALGAFLHLRDEMNDTVDVIASEEAAHQFLTRGQRVTLETAAINADVGRAHRAHLEDLGRREIEAVDILRDLLARS